MIMKRREEQRYDRDSDSLFQRRTFDIIGLIQIKHCDMDRSKVKAAQIVILLGKGIVDITLNLRSATQ